MKRPVWCLAVLALSHLACATASFGGGASVPSGNRDPHAVVREAVDAMGGEAALRDIHTLHVSSMGFWSSVETAARPEAPWPINFNKTETWLDFDRGGWAETGEYLALDGPKPGTWMPFALTVSDGVAMMNFDGKPVPGGLVHVGDAAEQVLYVPFRLALAALDAKALHFDGVVQVAGQPLETISFVQHGWPVKLFIDARTHRVTAAEVTHTLPNDLFWRVRGDVTDHLDFLLWERQASGVWLARQTNLTRNGVASYHDFTATLLEVNNAPKERFAIPDEIRSAFLAKPRSPVMTPAPGETPVAELSPGVFFAGTARANALLINQPEGSLLIDAPISDVYTGRTLDEIAHRFGKPARRLVLTDQILPTLSGLREAAARGVPITTVDADVGYVKGLLAAPHALEPDALAKSGKSGEVEGVAQRTTVGTGPTRVELIPMRTTAGERVLLVWLPESKTLWVGTALTLDKEGHGSASAIADLKSVVAREHLDVDQLVGSTFAKTDAQVIRR